MRTFPLKFVRNAFLLLLETASLPLLFLVAFVSRVLPKKIDVGLGPEPLINNIHHKKALQKYGYKAETFVSEVYYITSQFDKKLFVQKSLAGKIANHCNWAIIYALMKYRCVYLYFNGGMPSYSLFLWRFEPFFYKVAGVKTVVMPYGGDVQDLSRCPNPLYKNALSSDYPMHRLRRSVISAKIDLWTRHADHVIGGCDWVDYLYHWDTLQLAHFSIDVENLVDRACGEKVVESTEESRTFQILHAPNHRSIKGTQFLIQAIEDLQKEGLDVELRLLEKVPNEEVLKAISTADLVVDQLIIGWYAMFALESLAMGKPVVCYLRPDLLQFYENVGLIEQDEIPIISAMPSNIKDVIRDCVADKEGLLSFARKGSGFVRKHHSLSVIGQTFDKINKSIGLTPSG